MDLKDRQSAFRKCLRGNLDQPSLLERKDGLTFTINSRITALTFVQASIIDQITLSVSNVPGTFAQMRRRFANLFDLTLVMTTLASILTGFE
jgi:hypothetical protein